MWLLERDRISEEKRRKSVGIIRTEFHQLNRALAGILRFTQPRKPRLQEVNHCFYWMKLNTWPDPRNMAFFLFRKDVPFPRLILRCDPQQIRKLLIIICYPGHARRRADFHLRFAPNRT